MRCPNECRVLPGSGDGYHRVLVGPGLRIGGGTLEAWSTCPVCDGCGAVAAGVETP